MGIGNRTLKKIRHNVKKEKKKKSKPCSNTGWTTEKIIREGWGKGRERGWGSQSHKDKGGHWEANILNNPNTVKLSYHNV